MIIEITCLKRFAYRLHNLFPLWLVGPDLQITFRTYHIKFPENFSCSLAQRSLTARKIYKNMEEKIEKEKNRHPQPNTHPMLGELPVLELNQGQTTLEPHKHAPGLHTQRLV